MKLLPFIFTVISVLMPIITQKTGLSARYGLRIKMLCASLYLTVGILSAVAFFRVTAYSAMILVALIFGFLGDFFLSYNNEKYFLYGVMLFAIGHIVYSCVFLFSGESKAADYIIAVLIMSTVLYLPVLYLIKVKIDLKKIEAAFLVYASVLVFSFVCGFLRGILMIKNGNTFQGLCVITGSVLFITSDVILGLNHGGVKLPKLFRHAVSYTYFPAQTLFALSIYFQQDMVL
ncbi:lysoplasmalogenase [uncultured Fibrobacter sp.]|uniref:lysoplasmalogenase n=1 Tax=uncultured Fibrobacter sp. TaxID=261512 RepID=UPI002602851C|nr:lysoplasmalogenase [uncultured Fibrobacter sp.]